GRGARQGWGGCRRGAWAPCRPGALGAWGGWGRSRAGPTPGSAAPAGRRAARWRTRRAEGPRAGPDTFSSRKEWGGRVSLGATPIFLVLVPFGLGLIRVGLVAGLVSGTRAVAPLHELLEERFALLGKVGLEVSGLLHGLGVRVRIGVAGHLQELLLHR